MTTQELQDRINQLNKQIEHDKKVGRFIQCAILTIAFVCWVIITNAQVFHAATSDPNLDRQLFELINDYREQMGVQRVKMSNYRIACENAKMNYLTKGKVVISNVEMRYARSEGGMRSLYKLKALLIALPSDFLLSDKFTAIAVYSKGNEHYISFARK